MSGMDRADTRALAGDLWDIPAESDDRAQGPLLRRISAWFLGPAVLSAVWWTVTSPHFAHPEFRAALVAY